MISPIRLTPRALTVGFACALALRTATADVVNSLPPPELTPAQAQTDLRQRWSDFLARPKTGVIELAATPAEATEPERSALAASTTVSYQQPEEVWSVDGRLSVTLVGMMAHNRIGEDPVYLRTYNGKLVGPTLRAKPGDTIHVTLRNDFPTEVDRPGEMNTLHAFNTMNLHTHGLHVSPSGISDNVLLEVPPQSTQDYEIVIPRDHPCGTFWYHTHRHGSTAAQVSSGMAGAIIISGGMDNVPEIAKARERVMLFQQIAYLYKNCFPDKDKDGKPIQVCYDLPEGVIEQKYENRIFPPGSWAALGRFTTINGVRLPVFRVRPGSVERWRMVHAGIRESLRLKLERTPGADPSTPASIALNEIAVDGLPLGKVAPQQTIELWPGYRSDVLVQFPNIPHGDYLLVDEASPADESLDGIAEKRKYVGRIIVEGDPEPMTLPRNQQLAQYRLPSIPPTRDADQQTVVYGIISKDGVTTFNVNGRPFNMDRARELTLGGVVEWTLKSENIINGEMRAISHPHHIHVNPFEVYSIVDDKGVEHLKEPVWRDTIIVHGGWTIKARSRNEVFTGLFVQHCHILDHEDQGMMELVEIKARAGSPEGLSWWKGSENPSLRVAQPYAAAGWSLPDAAGQSHHLSDFRGRPTVLFFVKGQGCVHCQAQVGLFQRQIETFRRLGVNVVGVTTDSVPDLAAAVHGAPLPFLMVSDAQTKVFRRYGCFGTDEALHGTFVLDADGRVCWQSVGDEPFLAVDTVVAELARLRPPASVANQLASADPLSATLAP
jgi:FtsP/CotA-like multicopper oxidase with cupredoxin domain/peroxiredoxin